MSDINITEGKHAVRIITDADALKLAYRLRYVVFAEELGWIPENPAGLDIDEYDRYAVSFGVFSGTGKLLAYIRLVPGEKPFMMEKEFRQLVSGFKIRHEKDAAELSRLCVAPEAERLTVTSYPLSMFLLKGVYHWCGRNGIKHIYAVSERKTFDKYRSQGLPLNSLNEQDGNVALIMDWGEFERINRIDGQDLYSWFNKVHELMIAGERRLPAGPPVLKVQPGVEADE